MDFAPELLDSMRLVGHGLGALERAALQLGRGSEMAHLEMRLAILQARLQSGDTSLGLLAATRIFIEDFDVFVVTCFGSSGRRRNGMS